MQRHYDVIVMGRSIGALAAAALLARRDFTVLLLGNGALEAGYQAGEHRLKRRSFSFLAGHSPAWQRIITELAQTQTFKRRTEPLAPMLQGLARDRRLSIPPEPELFAREVRREFSELSHVVDDFYARLAEDNGATDAALSDDLIWPPGTFWERRETNKVAALLPHIHAEPDADLLADFPRGHFFRQLVRATVLFGTHLSALPPPFAAARLHGSWTRGLMRLPLGEDDLEEFLLERVKAHGGQYQLHSRAQSIAVRRGRVLGVLIEGEDEPTGCDFVITDLDGESIAGLAGGEGIHKRALREWPRITSTVGRFVTSLLVRKEGLPEPLGREVLIIAPERSRSQGHPAFLHLTREEVDAERELCVAELLLPDQGAVGLEQARSCCVELLARELPFLEQHLLCVDSVHDALPVWMYANGKRISEVDRGDLGLRLKEPMLRQLEVDPPGYLGLGGEPVRGPIERSLLVGRSVLPGLGQEGELLAAWSAARIVTRSDKKKAMMRRDMWTRMEFG